MDYIWWGGIIFLVLLTWYVLGLFVVYLFLSGKTDQVLAQYSKQQWLFIELATLLLCVTLGFPFTDWGRCHRVFKKR